MFFTYVERDGESCFSSCKLAGQLIRAPRGPRLVAMPTDDDDDQLGRDLASNMESDGEGDDQADQASANRTATDGAEAPAEGTELRCTGCRSKSTDDCPVAKKKNIKGVKITWGKTTVRKKKIRGQIHRVKSISGEWCRPCVNVVKKMFLIKKARAGVKSKPPPKGTENGSQALKNSRRLSTVKMSFGTSF